MVYSSPSSEAYKIDELETHVLITLTESRLDAALAPRLKSEFIILSGLGQRSIVLDLKNCIYCDSSGLSSLLVGNRICSNAGGVFVLRNLNPQVERLIAISHLDTILSIAYTEEQEHEFLDI